MKAVSILLCVLRVFVFAAFALKKLLTAKSAKFFAKDAKAVFEITEN
jgi:hypothetical protein